MARPVPRIGIPVVAVALALSGFFALFPARPASAALAFEDLVEPLLTAKTARCRVVARAKDQPALTFNTMFRGTVSRQEDKDMGMVIIVDEATGTWLTLQVKDKKATILQALNRDPVQSRGGGFLQSIREQILQFQQDEGSKRESLGEKKMANRTLVGYRISAGGMRMDIWGDQATGLPHTIVSNTPAFPNIEVTMTDFEFDVELDDSLFSLVPPAGYTVTKETVDASKPTEEDFTTALRHFTDLNDGMYPDAINLREGMEIVAKLLSQLKPPEDEREKELFRVMKILNRGFMFPLLLTAEADAAYAGQGVNRDDARKPIFWYKPEGAENYRVIRADLSVVESEEPPQADGAQRFPPPEAPANEAE